MTTDRRSKDLLSRVSEDLAVLKDDVSKLFSHTGRHTLPESAHNLADYGKDKWQAGGEFAASQLRYLKDHPRETSIGFAGGLILLGLVGYGAYYLLNKEKSVNSGSEVDGNDLGNTSSPYDVEAATYNL